MNKISKGVYQVAPGEQVTLECTPVEVGEAFVAAAVDGDVLVSPPGPIPTFKFTASTIVGTKHIVKIECSFPGDTPATARFDIKLKGSNGGEFSRSVANSDPIHDPEIEFGVVSASS